MHAFSAARERTRMRMALARHRLSRVAVPVPVLAAGSQYAAEDSSASTVLKPAPGSFLAGKTTVTILGPTTPANGDISPYAIRPVTKTIWSVTSGDVPVDNFNNASNNGGGHHNRRPASRRPPERLRPPGVLLQQRHHPAHRTVAAVAPGPRERRRAAVPRLPEGPAEGVRADLHPAGPYRHNRICLGRHARAQR
jgi:hypothetical protein